MDKQTIKELKEVAGKTKDEKTKKAIEEKLKIINKPVTK